jgi:hypothetical protein
MQTRPIGECGSGSSGRFCLGETGSTAVVEVFARPWHLPFGQNLPRLQSCSSTLEAEVPGLTGRRAQATRYPARE